jgi:hypothetical protein
LNYDSKAPLLEHKDGVKIVVQSREHLPPHIHAHYGDDEALVNIRTGEMFKGYIPAKKLKIVQEWLSEGNRREIVEENYYELNENLRPKETDRETIREKKEEKKRTKNSGSKKKGGK